MAYWYIISLPQNHFQLSDDSFLGMAFDFTSMTSTDIEVIVENQDEIWSLDETIQRPQPSPGNPWEKTPLNIYASLFNTIHRQTLKPNNNESRFYFTIFCKKFKRVVIFKIARKQNFIMFVFRIDVHQKTRRNWCQHWFLWWVFAKEKTPGQNIHLSGPCRSGTKEQNNNR